MFFYPHEISGGVVFFTTPATKKSQTKRPCRADDLVVTEMAESQVHLIHQITSFSFSPNISWNQFPSTNPPVPFGPSTKIQTSSGIN